ncbi:MAG: bifunctional methylenetetrahydrofolate dehydrogenase/methenyltetrahydrofolate cyclohydrolase FolD [Pseudomonadota bacterium]|nr:MAG: bifunctional methylenetetrahydrofolate dehydrogenase/methenyltetrahydrofolate cyclohydrolase FolD [Pseudomonadota bacterium]
MARLIDGKAIAAAVRADVKARVARFQERTGRAPGLDVVLVGDDPASHVYVRNKEKAALEVGMAGTVHRLPASTSETELLALVDELNRAPNVDGILVQFPVPSQIRQSEVIRAIDPRKDVDGLNPLNVGALFSGEPALVPCTPRGCMRLIAEVAPDVTGAHAVVVGRSNLVGKPVAALLLAANATVTIAHSRTRNLADVCRSADILVAAVGRARLIRGEWIRPGATVIDVGMNRDETGKLCGDVDFANAEPVAGAITPVPGGVGPMTIAMLLENTLLAAERRASK